MEAELEALLDDLTTSITPQTDPALIRIWLARPGDICESCAMAPECPDRSTCLHLVWSSGATRRLDGPFRRFPFGAREVGRVATTLEPMHHSGDLAALGVAPAGWLALHWIASFGAWPIARKNRCLGVVAVFARRTLTEADSLAIAAAARLAGHALAKDPIDAPKRAVAAAPAPAATMAETQRAAITAALARAKGRVSGAGGAAELLGMKPTTLESCMRKLGIRKPPRLLAR